MSVAAPTTQPIDIILSRLKRVKQTANGGYTALCPAHEDKQESLSIAEADDGRVLLKCFAGCDIRDIVGAMGLEMRDLFPHQDRSSEPGKQARVVAVYNYTDEAEKMLFQVVRFEPKNFRQRRPDGHGGWIWNTKDVRIVPYCLSRVLKAVAKGLPIFVVEGEKDADNLNALGLAATTNPRGAGKWPATKDFTRPFAGAKVVILPDNDEPGRKHAEKVARALAGVAAEIKVVNLPGLAPKEDVSDWLAAGGNREILLALVEEAPIWEPASGTSGNMTDGTGNGVNPKNAVTDLTNAQRLVAQHGKDLRFCWPWGKWLVWDSTRWQEDDTAEVIRRAKKTVRAMYAEAEKISDDKDRENFIKSVLKSESKERLTAMIALAASESGIPVLPSELDNDPWLLNVKNGTIDLRTGELRPHKREDMLTKIAPIVYDPGAECPRWKQFLSEIMDGNQNLVNFLQRAAGLSLTGDTSEHVLFILYGTGRNGKSTFLNTLLEALGDYGMTAAPDLLMAKQGDRHPTELADLFGKRMVVSMETGEGRRLAEALIKQLTGGDRIKARRMREDFWEFDPTHKLWLATNHKPRVRGTDVAIWSRLKLIPFNVSFAGREDKRLKEVLLTELPGILAWAVQGCLAWQQEGLGVPDEVAAATEMYKQEQDVLAAFLSDCCIINPLAKAAAKDLYQAYGSWCEETGEKPISQKSFGLQLAEHGFNNQKSTHGRVFWFGIGLRDSAEEVEGGGWLTDFPVKQLGFSRVESIAKLSPPSLHPPPEKPEPEKPEEVF